MKILRGLTLLAAIVVAACSAPAAVDSTGAGSDASTEKTIFVIRHLQKEQGDDPALSSQGAAAAQVLARLLMDKDIQAAFATPTRRAMETARPLAERIGVAVTQYDARHPEALVAAVAEIDGSVLVVGHSNTVPDLVARFGGSPVPQLTEEDYGTVFVIDSAGQVRELQVE